MKIIVKAHICAPANWAHTAVRSLEHYEPARHH